MGKLINIEDLTRAAKTYNNLLRELPFYTLNEAAKTLRLNIQKVAGEDIEINKRRQAGLLRPYKPGVETNTQRELADFFETSLKPERTFSALIDNITNYEEKRVISNQGEPVNNKTKKHPLELLILRDVVLSYSEDVIFTMFFAERDVNVASPMASYNGFFTKLDVHVGAGDVSEAKNNWKPTGVFDISGTLGIGFGSDGKNNYCHVNYQKTDIIV